MKHPFITIAILIVTAQQALFADTLKVGIGQPYTTIQSAINAAATGDTVKVFPGTYNEAIIINKNIVIQGSGYESTRITSANNPTVTMSGGKLMWFSITSISGDGIQATAGLITNDVIAGCGRYGVNFLQNSTASIKNSVILGNSSHGVEGYNNGYNGTAVNCISWNNGEYSRGLDGLKGVTYCDGSVSAQSSSNTIDVDPMFTSGSDFHIPPTSPCYGAGNPADVNPDGSRSDMGYFGGSDCPIYPVVTKILIVPVGNGQVQIQATAQANY